MTAESLVHYLQHPTHLYDITYQELNNLVAQYPYCQILRYLLMHKSKIENHKNYQQDLELAATYSIDRTLLHRQIELQKYQYSEKEEGVIFEDDYLELTELEKLEKKLEEKSLSTIFEEEEAYQAPISPIPENTIFTELLVEEFPIEETAAETPIPVESVNDIETTPPTEDTSISSDHFFIDTPSQEVTEEEEEVIPETAQNTSENIPEETEQLEEREQASLIDLILDDLLPPAPVIPTEKTELSTDNVVSFDDFIAEPEIETVPDLGMGENASDPLPSLEPLPPSIEDDMLLDDMAVSDMEMAPEIDVSAEDIIEEEVIEIDIHTTNIMEEESTLSVAETAELFVNEIDSSRPTSTEIVDENSTEKDAPAPKEESLQPQSKHSFSSWLKLYSQTEVNKETSSSSIPLPESTIDTEKSQRNKEIKKLLKASKKKKKSKSKKKITAKKEKNSKELDSASRSIMESEEIISQTLADLLASQGYSEKAIKMYERLSLIFPEKSAFFAQKIKELSYFD